MSDKMTGLSFSSLVMRLLHEYKKSSTIFSIHEDNFYKAKGSKVYSVFGEATTIPLGPAAGPHTQLSQNIVSSYLTGGRFLELKTVQLKVPHVSKPCIDGVDEGHNVEWSSEFEVEEAFVEYSNAYLTLYLLESLFGFGNKKLNHSFIFNMSVGYDMESIKNKRVDHYINSLKDASENEHFKKSVKELEEIVNGNEIKKILKGTKAYKNIDKLKDIIKNIDSRICKSLTLSTMHGCPPDEIEKIASYMIKEKKLNTYVKLNPTLLGYDRVRNILDTTGFNYVELNKNSFSHDLQYKDAKTMLIRLQKLAKDEGLLFGVKLTNTLGNINDKERLPGDERYMSGRALYPLSIAVASMIAKDFKGLVPISFSGGINVNNIKEVFETGIRPITLATDLLKPGGYNRLNQLADIIINSKIVDVKNIDYKKLAVLEKQSIKANFTQKDFRGYDVSKMNKQLPLTDCAIAPCVVECPIHQPIPEYVSLVGNGKYQEALNIISAENVLPGITAHICDHQCQKKCTRMDYDGAINIRDMKKLALLNAEIKPKKQSKKNNVKVAIIGAGPTGLSAASVLALEGFSVDVFDREDGALGAVKYLIPKFRISSSILKQDIKEVEKLGVNFNFNMHDGFTIGTLKAKGYKYICVAIGAYSSRELKLGGDNSNIMSAIDFLYSYNKNSDTIKLGSKVAIVGAGNTAMDSARAAKKIKGVKEVSIIYRRSEHEMPADREEILLAKKDGIKFYTLSNPKEYYLDGTLVCVKTKLGNKDESGRRESIETSETFKLKVDTLIASLGYGVSIKDITNAGINAVNHKVVCDSTNLQTDIENVFIAGDARMGASSIVKCIADGRKAAYSICKKENKNFKITDKKNTLINTKNILKENLIKRKTLFDRLIPKDKKEYAKKEALRCLTCANICSKCVDVCPNRANMNIEVRGFKDYYQIIHIDAYCNECGNCGFFCPYNGKPYKNKITVFSSKEEMLDSKNSGFYYGNTNDSKIVARFDSEMIEYKLEKGIIKNTGSSKEEKDFILVINTILTQHSYLTDKL